MNEEFELITVKFHLPPGQNENNCRTPTFKHVTLRNSAPHIWEEGKKFFHAVRLTNYEIKLALECFIFALA